MLECFVMGYTVSTLNYSIHGSYLIAFCMLVFGKYTTVLFLNSRRRSPSGLMNKTVMACVENQQYVIR